MKTIVFGKTMDRAKGQLIRIFKQMGYIDSQTQTFEEIADRFGISKVYVSTQWECRVELISGDSYHAVAARDNVRGMKANRIYVDAALDAEIISTCILPCLVYPTIPEKQVEFFY